VRTCAFVEQQFDFNRAAVTEFEQPLPNLRIEQEALRGRE
jgi:hypothetical protein